MNEENDISKEAQRFVGMIAAAKLGKDAGEDMLFTLTTINGKTFTFKNVEPYCGDWLVLTTPGTDKRINVMATAICDWNVVEREDIPAAGSIKFQYTSLKDLLESDREERRYKDQMLKTQQNAQPLWTQYTNSSGMPGTY